MKPAKCFLLLLTGLLFPFMDVYSQHTLQAAPYSRQSTVNPNPATTVDNDNRVIPPPCTTAPNDNYASAVTLTIGAAAIAGSTCGTLEAGEETGCNPSATQSVWYRVTATGANTYVIITTTGSCYVGAVIWPATGLPTNRCTMLDCQSAAYGPLTAVFRITGAAGTAYAIQITYGSGGPCGTEGTCTIAANNSYSGTISNPGSVNTCSSANAGCYFTFTPSVAQVTSTCPAYGLSTQSNLVKNQYFYFTTAAVNSNVLSFQNIIQSTCGSGNVQWFFWRLFDSSCNLLTCGDLGNLQNSVACNTTYRLEYMWEQLSCSYTSQWPYQYAPTGTIGCGALPVELLGFSAVAASNSVLLEWTTASEVNNLFFTVERSSDAEIFFPVVTIDGAGNSAQTINYSAVDKNPLPGISYYRLRQTDIDGRSTSSDIVAVNNSGGGIINIVPNPANDFINVIFDNASVKGNSVIEIIDSKGNVLSRQIKNQSHGNNNYRMKLSNYSRGMYIIKVTGASGDVSLKRFIID